MKRSVSNLLTVVVAGIIATGIIATSAPWTRAQDSGGSGGPPPAPRVGTIQPPPPTPDPAPLVVPPKVGDLLSAQELAKLAAPGGAPAAAAPLAAAAAASVNDGPHSHPALEARIAALELARDERDAIIDALTKRVAALEEAGPPIPPPPPAPVGTLVPGIGPEAVPEPVDVAAKNEEFPLTDDRRSQRLLIGDGSQDLWLGTELDGVWTPYAVEWSLNGGPWIGGRSVVTQVPRDLEDGTYQLRVVVYPLTGMSQPASRTVERRTFGEGPDAHVFWSYR